MYAGNLLSKLYTNDPNIILLYTETSMLHGCGLTVHSQVDVHVCEVYDCLSMHVGGLFGS